MQQFHICYFMMALKWNLDLKINEEDTTNLKYSASELIDFNGMSTRFDVKKKLRSMYFHIYIS